MLNIASILFIRRVNMYNIQTAYIDIAKLYELLDSIDKRLRVVEDATMELLHKEQKPAKEKKQAEAKK